MARETLGVDVHVVMLADAAQRLMRRYIWDDAKIMGEINDTNHAEGREISMPTTPLSVALEEGQDCLKLSPVIVLGSGASIPPGLPEYGNAFESPKRLYGR